MANKENNKKASQRFVDQPGQWVDITPASVKKKQEQAWKRLNESLNNTKKQKKK